MVAKITRLFLLFLLFLTACGGGGSGDDQGMAAADSSDSDLTGVTDYSGVFVGSVVSGVHYRATSDDISRDDITATDGTFKYSSRNGAASTVTFSIGDMILGSSQLLPVNGQKTTVFDLVDATDPEAANKAVNLYRFLRSLDETDDFETITITDKVRDALSGVGEKRLAELSPAAFDAEMDAIMLRSGVPKLVSRVAVEAHILQTKLQVDASRIETLTLATGTATVQADGVSQVLLRALVTDVNRKAVQGVRVQFQTTAGSLAADNVHTAVRITDAKGQAYVFLTAPRQPLAATVSISAGGLSEIGTLAFIAPDPVDTEVPADSQAGKSASIQMTVDVGHLFVQGVGKVEQAQVIVSILDGLGNLLDETARGYAQSTNNLRVTMKSHPGGGEMLSGLKRQVGAGSGVDMEAVRDSQTIDVRTTNGKAVLTLRSGSLPGVVELQAKLLDIDGATVVTTAFSTLIAIASGPPHSIVLTHSNNASLVNLVAFGLSGVYCQMGSVLVTDRYGNAVPDNTAISLGLIDAVIHAGSGTITKNSNYLTMVSPDDRFETMVPPDDGFASASIEVDGVQRQIQVNDRVLIPKGVFPADRMRFVKTTGSATQLQADLAYLRAEGDPESMSIEHYYVGASLRGGAIHGYSEVSRSSADCDPTKLTTGITTTTGGIAPVRVTYPANKETILTGCFADVMDDKRHANPRSAQVLVIASTNDGSTTTIDDGGFCFNAAAPSRLMAVPDALSYSTSPIDDLITTLTITLEDAGGVRLPFIPITCSSVIAANFSGNMSVVVTPDSDAMTNKNGQVVFNQNGQVGFNVKVAGGGGGDLAAVVCSAMDAQISISVLVP